VDYCLLGHPSAAGPASCPAAAGRARRRWGPSGRCAWPPSAAVSKPGRSSLPRGASLVAASWGSAGESAGRTAVACREAPNWDRSSCWAPASLAAACCPRAVANPTETSWASPAASSGRPGWAMGRQVSRLAATWQRGSLGCRQGPGAGRECCPAPGGP
jgi:hypothetical protein